MDVVKCVAIMEYFKRVFEIVAKLIHFPQDL